MYHSFICKENGQEIKRIMPILNGAGEKLPLNSVDSGWLQGAFKRERSYIKTKGIYESRI